ncbi:ROOT MERISTEM GROWTH FACTOR 2 [Salix viminalis]|uniref:ROOT MERISTEM GROWTH FACTOR 2 n=1 Tax=Salix viminalis TaxID=40686 RepID=A0A9Q0QJ89_SALVM|nr:ROOT MERISTEM GROWTH FACTOR 2 [Salix viminalis]
MLKEYRESEKMVYRRFLVLALGLLFVINAIWGSCAHDYHDWEMKKKKETVGIGENTVSVHKELLSGFSTARTRKMDLGGKKMAAQKESRGKPEKEKGFQGKASEDNSGANYSTVKCDFQVKGSSFNVRCKRGARKKSPKTRRGPGFLAFGDDYRGPKQHPPKHN